ncbi:hypothetical protein M9980_09715 [Sphingomonas donggukensis]|uniref:Uncharacterized protein n=1 Tax=Sphingomonas donggukensis TaxID=2949093 RepID=A0ABY4TR23_9SPHN|nr:hypothetical protein [Sphingomonas donggukensis]URW74843.1 hypothetical protein M9980_09715 [Sphingomonas donggukensis]
MDDTYQFTIDGAYSPATLPMERLAEYMAALAKLLGEKSDVHFRSVEPGSAVLVAAIDEPAQPKVRDRTEKVRDGIAPQDAVKAFGDLDNLLRKDNAKGRLVGAAGAVIIPFPGRERVEPVSYGAIRQEGTIDGQLIRVGGTGDTIPVHLRDGDLVYTGLYTDVATSQRLAEHYMKGPLRVSGTGVWQRSEDGDWTLDSFKVVDFELLDDAPLPQLVEALRRVSGSGWRDVADPVADLTADRRGDDR